MYFKSFNILSAVLCLLNNSFIVFMIFMKLFYNINSQNITHKKPWQIEIHQGF